MSGKILGCYILSKNEASYLPWNYCNTEGLELITMENNKIGTGGWESYSQVFEGILLTEGVNYYWNTMCL